MFFASGNKYVGTFKKGQINGLGAYFLKDGSVQNGIWKNG